MTTTRTCGKVNYRLLGLLSDLVICSRCLRNGTVTPVPQVISERHKPRTLCRRCVELPAARPGRSGRRMSGREPGRL